MKGCRWGWSTRGACCYVLAIFEDLLYGRNPVLHYLSITTMLLLRDSMVSELTYFISSSNTISASASSPSPRWYLTMDSVRLCRSSMLYTRREFKRAIECYQRVIKFNVRVRRLLLTRAKSGYLSVTGLGGLVSAVPDSGGIGKSRSSLAQGLLSS